MVQDMNRNNSTANANEMESELDENGLKNGERRIVGKRIVQRKCRKNVMGDPATDPSYTGRISHPKAAWLLAS